jgi:hypothetical protein
MSAMLGGDAEKDSSKPTALLLFCRHCASFVVLNESISTRDVIPVYESCTGMNLWINLPTRPWGYLASRNLSLGQSHLKPKSPHWFPSSVENPAKANRRKTAS